MRRKPHHCETSPDDGRPMGAGSGRASAMGPASACRIRQHLRHRGFAAPKRIIVSGLDVSVGTIHFGRVPRF
jgi:hypothetical protein